MAIYIENGEKKSVILDPKGDDDLMIERFSKIPGMTVRKATDDEVKRLLEPSNTMPLGRSFT
ncbi:MAG: hypothetical protein V7749_01050 [Cocleimonas sp.]